MPTIGWIDALRQYNAGMPSWCVPRKGTPGYDMVMRIRQGEKPKSFKELTAELERKTGGKPKTTVKRTMTVSLAEDEQKQQTVRVPTTPEEAAKMDRGESTKKMSQQKTMAVIQPTYVAEGGSAKKVAKPIAEMSDEELVAEEKLLTDEYFKQVGKPFYDRRVALGEEMRKAQDGVVKRTMTMEEFNAKLKAHDAGTKAINAEEKEATRKFDEATDDRLNKIQRELQDRRQQKAEAERKAASLAKRKATLAKKKEKISEELAPMKDGGKGTFDANIGRLDAFAKAGTLYYTTKGGFTVRSGGADYTFYVRRGDDLISIAKVFVSHPRYSRDTFVERAMDGFSNARTKTYSFKEKEKDKYTPLNKASADFIKP